MSGARPAVKIGSFILVVVLSVSLNSVTGYAADNNVQIFFTYTAQERTWYSSPSLLMRTSPITIYVNNTDNKLVKVVNTKLTMPPSSSLVKTLTAEFYLDPGVYLLKAVAPRYEPYYEVITVKSGDKISKWFEMTHSPACCGEEFTLVGTESAVIKGVNASITYGGFLIPNMTTDIPITIFERVQLGNKVISRFIGSNLTSFHNGTVMIRLVSAQRLSDPDLQLSATFRTESCTKPDKAQVIGAK